MEVVQSLWEEMFISTSAYIEHNNGIFRRTFNRNANKGMNTKVLSRSIHNSKNNGNNTNANIQ